MLETKYVGDNFEMLVTVLVDFVTNILYLFALASGTNIQKMSPISKFCHQHPKNVTSIKSISTCHQHLCSEIGGFRILTWLMFPFVELVNTFRSAQAVAKFCPRKSRSVFENMRKMLYVKCICISSNYELSI